MKPKDIFGLLLRCAALWITIWGAWQLIASIARLPATVTALFTSAPLETNSLVYFVYGFPGFVGGLLVLRFADFLVGFTYRKPTD